MPQPTSYIFFNGQCAEAMRFYERTLGGKIEMMLTGAQSPEADKLPPGAAEQILHASLSLPGGGALLASDSMGQPYEGMKGFALSLSYSNAVEARRVFDALAAGGQVTLPLGKTFWSEAFGMLTDRFGTPWMIGVDH